MKCVYETLRNICLVSLLNPQGKKDMWRKYKTSLGLSMVVCRWSHITYD